MYYIKNRESGWDFFLQGFFLSGIFCRLYMLIEYQEGYHIRLVFAGLVEMGMFIMISILITNVM